MSDKSRKRESRFISGMDSALPDLMGWPIRMGRLTLLGNPIS